MSHQEKRILTFINHILGNPYALQSLWVISKSGKATYQEIRQFIVYVTNTDLKSSLHILIENGLIVYDGNAYTLTKKGNELIPVLKNMVKWGKEHME